MGWVRTWWVPFLRGRAQYLPRAKTVLHGAFPYGAHLSFGGDIVWSSDSSSNFDLSVRLMRATAGRSYEEESKTNKIGTVKMLPQNP